MTGVEQVNLDNNVSATLNISQNALVNTAAGANTVTLSNGTNRVVALRSAGVVSTSTSTTNWNNTADYMRLYTVVAASSQVTSYEDHRFGVGGVFSAGSLLCNLGCGVLGRGLGGVDRGLKTAHVGQVRRLELLDRLLRGEHLLQAGLLAIRYLWRSWRHTILRHARSASQCQAQNDNFPALHTDILLEMTAKQ